MGSGLLLLMLVVVVVLGAGVAGFPSEDADDDLADVEVLDNLANTSSEDGGGAAEPFDGVPEEAPEVATQTASTARKCCPPGLSMYRVNAPGCDNQVTCKITDSASSTLWSLQPGGSPGQYGFPTTCPRERCHLQVLDDANATASTEPYCTDILVETDHSGQLVAEVMASMTCIGAKFDAAADANAAAAEGAMQRLRAPAPTVPVVPFRKCCAVHESYDLASRTCRGTRGGVPVDVTEEGEDAVSTTTAWPLAPPADYEPQRRAASALLVRVFHKNLTALVDMSVGPPDCEQGPRGDDMALLDVAVFDLPWDEHLVDEQGVVVLHPAVLLADPGDAGASWAPPWRLPPGDYCVDEAYGDGDGEGAGTLVVKVCLGQNVAPREQVCSRFGCFRKCCPHHEYFAPRGDTHACVPRPISDGPAPLRPQVHEPPAVNQSDKAGYLPRSAQELVDDAYKRYVEDQRPQQVVFSSVVDNVCPELRFRLSEGEDVWFFDRFGTLYQPEWPEITSDKYCVDDTEELANLSVLACLAEVDPTQEGENSRILLITIGLLISCMFLALTLLTYCCLPALQNLHGKTLMCHVSSLLVAYLFLALTQILTKPVFLDNEWICSIIGYCVLFTFISAFSWLNVMCFDIWRTFGGMTSTRTVKRSSASRRFRWYCAYAWGVSSFITVVCITVDQWPGNDKGAFRPQIGDGSCWFRTEQDPESQGQSRNPAYGILIFFAGPLLVQTCSNLVLFVLTVRNYSRIKSEINRMHTASNSRKVKKFEADSNKLKMNVKLFVVMGVTWVLEVVSTFFPREHAVFYLSDAANALQGVMIFAIFVLKRKVVRALAVKLGRAPPPPPCYSANPSVTADCRLNTGLAVRGKTTSTNTLFTSDFRTADFRSTASNRALETPQ